MFSETRGNTDEGDTAKGIKPIIPFRIVGVTKVYEVSKLLQTVLFLTDFVFIVLFAYFDESMSSIGGYEP